MTLFLQGAIIVAAILIAYHMGARDGRKFGEVRGYALGRDEARAESGIVEQHLGSLLHAVIVRNHALAGLLRTHAPELFVAPPVETPREVKPS